MFIGDNAGYEKYALLDKYITLNAQGTGMYYCYCKQNITSELCNEYQDDIY
jgi:hypothetical protein